MMGGLVCQEEWTTRLALPLVIQNVLRRRWYVDYKEEVGIELGGIWKIIFQPNRMAQGFGVSLRPGHSTDFIPKSQAEGKKQHSHWGIKGITIF
jgi:hypothetical protein